MGKVEDLQVQLAESCGKWITRRNGQTSVRLADLAAVVQELIDKAVREALASAYAQVAADMADRADAFAVPGE
ncbi:hypothetical protein ACFQ1S_14505 [Kibdelosporangium lantanae]|uniref:YbaB/EbfC DNA-binding family protein n=1 Tax=Kibdelosporangium lantanae TaxID=1497396 RepID=A0ABW3M936_9PSEU